MHVLLFPKPKTVFQPTLHWLILVFHLRLVSSHSAETVVTKNGTELRLKCAPAEVLVRTHMAPDFENPSLVRRLDWFHDESLIASYQQVGLSRNES